MSETSELKFRSYTPKDEEMLQFVVERQKVEDLSDGIALMLKEMAQKSKQNQDILSLAPKKAAWDL